MKRKLIKWLLLITWMLLIFYFSNQPNSGEKTFNIINHTTKINSPQTLKMINYLVRKSAHITEYFILAILTISLLKEYITNYKLIYTLSIFICFIYAITDEIHQHFIVGRTAIFKDVIIDTTGSLLLVIILVIKKKLNKKANT